MKKVKQRAVLCTMGSALFMAVALLLARNGIWVPAVFGAVLGILSAAECFELGRDYQFEAERNFDELEMKLKKKEFEWQIVEEKTYAKVLCCKRCHGTEFRKVADRLVCNTCGEVMEHGNDET